MLMRKTIMLCSALLFCVQSVMSEPVSREAASAAARAFLAAKGVTMPSVRPAYKAPRRQVADETSAYYVFNAGGDNGFVVVSGDTRAEEILGYVDHGTFCADSIPENMRAFLQTYADEIAELDEQGVTDEEVRRAPRRVNYARHTVSPILTCHWGQGLPYSLTVPYHYEPDGRYLPSNTGCPSTAMAQILYHYKYPKQVVRDIPAHTCTYRLNSGEVKSVVQPAIPAGTPIDWDHMLDSYDGTEDSIYQYAVADLVNMCGLMIGTSYSSLSGGASAIYHGAVQTYLGYDDCVLWKDRRNYDYEDWLNLLWGELAEGYPILIQGLSSGGGHSFIVDGFDGDCLFHINWGWGGTSDGWFRMSSLSSPGKDACISAKGYTRNQAVLINLRLPDDVQAPPYRMMSISDIRCIKNSVSAIYKNETGSLNSFSVALTTYDEETGKFTPFTTQQTVGNLADQASRRLTFRMANTFPEGIYELHPAARLLTSDEWVPCLSFRQEHIRATVDANGTMTLERSPRAFELHVDEVSFPGTLQKGKEQPVYLTLSNTGDEFYRELFLYAGQNGEKNFQNSRMYVQVPKNGTNTVCFYFTPDNTGTYDVWISSWQGETDYAHATIEITSAGVHDDLAVSAINIRNKTNGVIYGNRLDGIITVRNKMDRDFHGNISLQIWINDANNPSIYWSSVSRIIKMDIAAGKSANGTFNFNNLNNDRTYCIVVGYADQDGTLENGGKWSQVFRTTPGILTWKANGAIATSPDKDFFNTPNDRAGVYLNGTDVKRLTTGSTNPNTIYSFAGNVGMPDISTSLPHVNIVRACKADSIILHTGYPYYADSTITTGYAALHHTFSSRIAASGWDAITLPFAPDSIIIDSVAYKLGEESAPFAVYQLTMIGSDGKPVFEPAKRMRGQVPYIICAEKELAGKTITFVAHNTKIYGQNDIEAIVSAGAYKMRSSTFQKAMKSVYTLNADGTAFVLSETSKTVSALTPYFETTLIAEGRPGRIDLPFTPMATAIQTARVATSFGSYPIYNEAGQCVGRTRDADDIRSLPNLKPGIYIVGGRKVMVK